ncbi:hypothetical protein E2562_028993 [Oryza meyeriana var. granulata]|uniref:DUF4283 domain-containing protein n=1 Tax=Oryza meyeriana var. granulata TaxID=110450 RepID=A0A6G1E3C6_9ORYZ|nr:hypothetical protein E2562_028993 [Oryza meyeriana var. granulata]
MASRPEKVEQCRRVDSSLLSLILKPWTRQAQAWLRTLSRKVFLELEGFPAHVWSWQTAATIISPSCWLEKLHPDTADCEDWSVFKLEARTADPGRIPKVVEFQIDEPEPPREDADDPIFGHLPLLLREKKVLT